MGSPSGLFADVVVIGAGASGLACAVQCAKSLGRCGLKRPKVVVLEASSKPGRSILASGNGRCNFSNRGLTVAGDRSMYWNADFVAASAKALRNSEEVSTLTWLRSLGLVWQAPLEGGLLYPYSNKASTVLEVLLAACERWGVEILPDVRIDEVEAAPAMSVDEDDAPSAGQRQLHEDLRLAVSPRDAGFGSGVARFRLKGECGVEVSRKKTASGRIKRTLSWEPCSFEAERVVIAVGGKPSAGLVPGHTLVPLKPVLAPIRVRGPLSLKSLDGVRAKVGLTVLDGGKVAFSEAGEVLFREYGMSGIVTFNASRYLFEGATLLLDFAPDFSAKELSELLRFLSLSRKGEGLSAVLSGMFAPEIASLLSSYADKVADPVSAIKEFPVSFTGVFDGVSPQVHRGGVDVSQIEPSTLQSKRVPGLYVLGEALDVDGPCGGYNLDWAWTCGILAGSHLAERFGSDD